MADAVVSFLLGKLGLFTQQETKLLSGVGDDAVFIKEELERINAFLRVTDTMEEVDPQLGIWINQVRNFAFDIEDVVDEFNLRLAYDQGESSMRETIRGIKNLKYRHHIASKFRRFKSRVISISEGYERYKLDFPNQGSSSIARINCTWQERRGDALLLDDDDLVGTDEPKRKLVNWLVKEEVPAFRVISVVGMGGLGKTTLVKKVYDDVERQKHFRSHAWITVSQSFKLEKLLKNIIRQLYEESKEATPKELDTMDSLGLKKTIKKYLQDRRYLIVLDDVWNQEAWDAIKYAFPKKHGDRVMLTTRNHEVANAASCFEFEGEVYLLDPLSWEMSWQLFCKKTFHGRDCPSHLEGIAKQILKKCEGLPLAIVTLSGLLATKNQNNIDEWEMVKQSLGVELENDKLISMTKILSLSYYELPFHLKACLLHVSMFPEDYEIVHRRLVRLWIAEEFVNEVKGKTMEEVGKSYLNELLHRSLLQVASRGGTGAVYKCRIHDMLREVVVSKCKDQSFAMILNEKNEEWPTKARRLAIHNTLGDWDGRNNNNIHILWGGLRSLMLFGIVDFPPLKSSFRKLDLKMVKILDLTRSNLEKFPNEITKLYHLRLLDLSDNNNISVIPESIGKLINLVTLNLSGTRVTKLPSTIKNLGRLRHLLVYNKEKAPDSISKVRGFDAKSAGIGYLHSLQQLWCVELKEGDDDGGIIEEIGKLRQLRELGISNLKRQDGMALCSSLDKLPHLRLLDIDGAEEILELHNISSPPKFLQELALLGRLEKVPHWISALTNLAALRLIGSRVMIDNNNNNILKVAKGLPNLVFLSLDHAFEGNELCFEVGGFQKLNTLWLSNFQALTKVVVEDGALPLLEKLFIHRCVVMDILPLGIQNLAKLKLLKFQDVSDTLIETIDRSKLGGGGDFWRIQHIQQVKIFRYNRIERKWIEIPL